MSRDQLVQAVTALMRAAKGRPVLAALDGHSAAGKSTLAAAIASEVETAVIPMDDFYRDESDALRQTYDAAQGVDRYFDWQRLLEQAVLPLRAGTSSNYQAFDWHAGAGLAAPTTIEPASVVILEGVYSARPELRPYLDLTVLVEAPAEARLQRQRERHDPHDWEARWDAAERLYVTSICPRASFDIVISGLVEE